MARMTSRAASAPPGNLNLLHSQSTFIESLSTKAGEGSSCLWPPMASGPGPPKGVCIFRSQAGSELCVNKISRQY